jgi:hypothetical protein
MALSGQVPIKSLGENRDSSQCDEGNRLSTGISFQRLRQQFSTQQEMDKTDPFK